MAVKLEDISVVIPVYNGQATLERCLTSLSDVWAELREVILVDDGSVDETSKIAARFAKQYESRFRLIGLQSNQGSAVARNLGIQNSTGNVLLFLDADDEIDGSTLKEAIKDFSEEADFLICGVWFVHGESGEILRKEVFEQDVTVTHEQAPLDYLLRTRCFFRVLYRRDFLISQEISFFPKKNEILAPFFNIDDYFFQLESILYAKSISASSVSFYKYYVVPSDRKRYREQAQFFHLGYKMFLDRFVTRSMNQIVDKQRIQTVFDYASRQLVQCIIEVRGFNSIKLSNQLLLLLWKSPLSFRKKLARYLGAIFSFFRVNVGFRSRVYGLLRKLLPS